MVRLDVLGILLTVFLLGPANWRWSLLAMAIAKGATLLLLVFGQAPVIAYTMGGMFNQLELDGQLVKAILLIFAGPVACYSFVRFQTSRPFGDKNLFAQLLPWSELENPLRVTVVKYALFSALFNIVSYFV
ncbi:MAG: hypothetical protein FH749_05030 [Firmicutes bacterium]|nr:hypothetical protein [Bacillota bacterium]